MKTPLLPVVVMYGGGILAARFVGAPLYPLLLLALALCILGAAWARARSILLAAALLLAGGSNYLLRTDVLSPHDLRTLLGQQPTLATVRGVVCETPTLRLYEHGAEPAWRLLARVQVSALRRDKGDWQTATGRVAISTPGALTNIFAGQIVEVFGVIAPPAGAAAEGTFDYRAYLRDQGIHYQVKAGSEKDWRILASVGPPLEDRFREWARRALRLGLPSEDEDLRLEWALSLGWKPALTAEVSEPFVQAATYHIFAVDGLRMAIIFGIFFALFRAFSIPRAICGLVLLPITWFYVALTGWPASAIRAAVMLTIVIVGWAMRRPLNPANSLYAAALGILTWQPTQLFQAGFQLSFCVVLILILMLPPLLDLLKRITAPEPLLPPHLRRRWPRWVVVPGRFTADLALTSFVAWVGSIPLVAYYFHIVTPVSTPANILAVPLCVLVLISNFLSLLHAAWFPAAAEIFNHAGWFFMNLIRTSSDWFAGWPLAYRYVCPPNLFTCALYYALLLGLITGWLLKPKWRAGKIAAAGVALAIWCGLQFEQRSSERLTILPANGGFAVYCSTKPARSSMLVDCGNTNSVQYLLKPFLRAQGVNVLPNLLLTHGDLRHVGGARSIVSEFDIRKVWVSPVRFRSPAYRSHLAALREQTNLVNMVSRGQQLPPWSILHPDPADRFSQADDSAVVLLGTFGGKTVLLLSDLGRLGQERLCARYPDLKVDIVVAGLPSAGEPLSPALLETLAPRLVIIADSELPASERASEKLKDRLGGLKAPIVYTRAAGAATVEFTRNQWRVRTMQGDEPREVFLAEDRHVDLPTGNH